MKRKTSAPAGKPVGRRVVLGVLGAGVLGVVFGPAVQGVWRGIRSVASQVMTGGGTVKQGAGGFRYYSIVSSVPRKDASDYRLTVGGLVDKPLAFTLDQLRALPQSAVTKDVHCTDGWVVDEVPFTGVKLADLLDAAGVRPDAHAVRFTCFDGAYSESLTLEQARRDDVLVALTIQGGPISHDAGGPVRLYVAPMYYYKSAKWLSGIELTAEVKPGYWEKYGYPIDGWLPGDEPKHG